jgi:hypothetical protein
MPINESFGNLVNDITDQILKQVNAQVQATISDSVERKINQSLTPEVIERVIASRVEQSIRDYRPDMSKFDSVMTETGTNIINGIQATADQRIKDIVTTNVNAINIKNLVNEHIIRLVNNKDKDYLFSENSIPGYSIEIDSLKITGNQIEGGVVKNFASTGFDDKATQCQVTVMDAGTIFENTLYAPRLEIKGDAVIDGDLLIKGKMPEDSVTYQNIVRDATATTLAQIGPELLDQHQGRVFERIKTEGLTLNKISIGDRTIIEGDTLTDAIINSRLQTVGLLRDLQTQGESLLSETLYASNKRVGINTMDPATALSIWDEEVEIGLGKKKQDVAQLGTRRAQALVLSSNNQNNITLESDGTTSIPKLRIGNMVFESSSAPPQYDAPKGSVVFNENPSLGGPLGWVSLGQARWANFGIIE